MSLCKCKENTHNHNKTKHQGNTGFLNLQVRMNCTKVQRK